MVGKTISHCKILEELAEGGAGIAYKAEENKLKRDVAIKFLPRQIAASEEERECFEIETEVCGQYNNFLQPIAGV